MDFITLKWIILLLNFKLKIILIFKNPIFIYICNWYRLNFLESTNFTENNFRYEDIIFEDVNTLGPGWAVSVFRGEGLK